MREDNRRTLFKVKGRTQETREEEEEEAECKLTEKLDMTKCHEKAGSQAGIREDILEVFVCSRDHRGRAQRKSFDLHA